MSAFEIFRRLYRDSVTPIRVTQMLLMRDDLPQSVHRCLDELQSNLTAVANDQSAETERRAGEIQASLHFGRIDDIFKEGLHEYLLQFLDRIRDLVEAEEDGRGCRSATCPI